MDTLAKRAKNLWRRRTQLPGLKSSSGWDSASSAGSSQGSIATVASSQFSDGSIDGTLLAIEDLVSDHIEHLSKTLKRRSRLHFEYIERLGQLRESVRSKRVYLTSRDEERERKLLDLYHDMRDEFKVFESRIALRYGEVMDQMYAEDGVRHLSQVEQRLLAAVVGSLPSSATARSIFPKSGLRERGNDACPEVRIGICDPSFPHAGHVSILNLSTKQDLFAFLATFHTVLLVDDSTRGRRETPSRIMQEAAGALTAICAAHDMEGVDMYFFSLGSSGWFKLRSSEEARMPWQWATAAFTTPMGARIDQILTPYLDKYKAAAASGETIKPINMVVLTASVSADDPGPVIARIARQLDTLEAPPRQIGIQFVQVGTDEAVAEALQSLEDYLRRCPGGEFRQIVDIATFKTLKGRGSENFVTASSILTVMLGAVMRRCCQRWLVSHRGSPSLSRMASDWLRNNAAAAFHLQ